MRLIIAGSRTFNDYDALCEALKQFKLNPTLVISGTAKGADQLGEYWAKEHNIPIKRFPADWNRFGRKAGYIRNLNMAYNADALLAFWDGKSKGTKHMIDIAKKRGLQVYVRRFDDGK